MLKAGLRAQLGLRSTVQFRAACAALGRMLEMKPMAELRALAARRFLRSMLKRLFLAFASQGALRIEEVPATRQAKQKRIF